MMIKRYIDDYIENFYPYKMGRWCYEDGLILNASWKMYEVTKEKKYYDFVEKYYDNMIDSDGNIKEYTLEEFNIDNIAGGIVLIDLYLELKKEKYLIAINTLYKQLTLHPRTKEGSFWHKKIYPNQVWMDGIYMGLVFYSKYAKVFGNDSDIKDIQSQLNNFNNRLYDENRDLYVHAYDESKTMQWANKDNGRSPNVWSRACGWVAMALVDIYDNLGLEICKTLYIKLINGLKKHLKEGMLYQVVDMENEEGNYLETSGSAMVAYSMLKATRLKIYNLKVEGLIIFDSIKDNYYKKSEEDLKYHLEGICKVAGLDNIKRNGSFEYYMSEAVVSDEVKGVSPFILTYSEILRK